MKAKFPIGALLLATFSVAVLGVIVVSVATPKRRPVRASADYDAPRRDLPGGPVSDQPHKREGEQRPRTTEADDEGAYYRGPVSIVGRVVEENGSLVPNATVLCRPLAFCVDGRKRFSRRTDDGSFRFDELPRASQYELRALAKGGAGSRTLSLDYVTSNEVALLVKEVTYERFRFSSEGKPVNVSGLVLLLARGAVLYSSDRVTQGGGVATTNLRDLGVKLVPPLGPNEWLAVYSRPVVEKQRSVHIPGYKRRSLPASIMSVEEWPRAIDVELEPDDRGQMVEVRVVIPKLSLPEGWPSSRFRLVLGVQFGEPRLTTPVSAVMNRVGVSSELVSRLGLVQINYGFSKVPYELRREGKALVLEPNQTYGYLDLFFDVSLARSAASGLSGYLTTDPPTTLINGVPMRPGHTRFGPIPAGTYRAIVMRTIPGHVARPEYSDPIRIHEGANAFRWK